MLPRQSICRTAKTSSISTRTKSIKLANAGGNAGPGNTARQDATTSTITSSTNATKPDNLSLDGYGPGLIRGRADDAAAFEQLKQQKQQQSMQQRKQRI